MIKTGYKPRKFLWWHVDDHRDHDFIKTFGAAGIPDLPLEVDNDRKLWLPNQNSSEPIFNNPPMPNGCTDYAQNDLAANYAGELFNPGYTESKVHANQNGGADMRVSFGSIVNDGVQTLSEVIKTPFKQYFNVKAQGILDWFDSFRSCLFLSSGDHREISVGIKWWPQWTLPVNGSGTGFVHVGTDGILPTPDWNNNPFSWHDAVICGYVVHNTKGQLIRGAEQFLKIKSWQGTEVGDNGFLYMSRSQVNMSFSFSGTLALVGSPVKVDGVETIDLSWVQWVVSFVRMVAGNYILRPLGLV